MSAYIFLDGLPGTAPPESTTGPAGTCNGSVNCESFNFGYAWARHWVVYSQSVGLNPTLWWLDVEGCTPGALVYWRCGSAPGMASNAQVVAGAVAGIRSSGLLAGIYSTSYQWGIITGSSLSYPNMPLWIPGAQSLTGPGYSATNYCASSTWAPRFAGGTVVLVQYGTPSPYDQDYACS
jgi:hypothetical protein